MERNNADLNNAAREMSGWITALRNEIGKAIVGQRYMIDRMLVGLLVGGHMLLEGIPGLGKTTAIRSLASAINGSFKRIQFTPDMLPADIVGTEVFDPKSGEFYVKQGPVFANIVLADEINRSPAKVQSALLECMQERQVTIAGTVNSLPDLFTVFATENPIEHEGTYPLPESQIDRFFMKLKIEYPSKLEEIRILQDHSYSMEKVSIAPVVSIDQILHARKFLDKIFVDDKIYEYIVDIVSATRCPSKYGMDMDQLIEIGCSPRAAIALVMASKAWAFLQGRSYVTPQDVKTIAIDVLRHRIVLTYLAEADNFTSEIIASRILNTIKVP